MGRGGLKQKGMKNLLLDREMLSFTMNRTWTSKTGTRCQVQ